MWFYCSVGILLIDHLIGYLTQGCVQSLDTKTLNVNLANHMGVKYSMDILQEI